MAVCLLMAVQVYEDNVFVFSPVDVVAVEFLSVMETLTTEWAGMVLDTGSLLSGEREVFGFFRCPLCPVFPQTRVIGREGALDHYMPPHFEPPELQQVEPGLLGLRIAKHPLVIPVWVQPSPVPAFQPVPVLVRIGVSYEAHFPPEHPFVEVLEDPTCYRGAMVARPSPDDGVECARDCFGITAA